MQGRRRERKRWREEGERAGQAERQPPGARSLECGLSASNFSQVAPGCTLLQLKGVSSFIRTQALIYNPPRKIVLLAESWNQGLGQQSHFSRSLMRQRPGGRALSRVRLSSPRKREDLFGILKNQLQFQNRCSKGQFFLHAHGTCRFL